MDPVGFIQESRGIHPFLFSFDLSYYIEHPDQADTEKVVKLLPELFRIIKDASEENRLILQKFIRYLSEKLPAKEQIEVYVKASAMYPLFNRAGHLGFEKIWLLMKAHLISQECHIDLSYEVIQGEIDRCESDIVNNPFVKEQIHRFFTARLDEISRSFQLDSKSFHQQYHEIKTQLENLTFLGRSQLAVEFYGRLLSMLGKQSPLEEIEKGRHELAKETKQRLDLASSIQHKFSSKWQDYQKEFLRYKNQVKNSEEFSKSLKRLLTKILTDSFNIVARIAPCTFDFRIVGSVVRHEATFLSDVDCSVTIGAQDKREHFIRYFLPIYLGVVRFYLNCLPGILIVDPSCSYLFKRIGCDIDGSFLKLLLGGEEIVFHSDFCENRTIEETPLVNSPEKLKEWILSELRKTKQQRDVSEAPYSLLLSESVFCTGNLTFSFEEDFWKENRSIFTTVAFKHCQNFKSRKEHQKGTKKNLKKGWLQPFSFGYYDLFLLLGLCPTSQSDDSKKLKNQLLPEKFLSALEEGRNTLQQVRWRIHQLKKDKPYESHQDDFDAPENVAWKLCDPSNRIHPWMEAREFNDLMRIEESILQQLYQVLEYLETIFKLTQSAQGLSEANSSEERMFLTALCLFYQNKNLTLDTLKGSFDDLYKQAKNFFVTYMRKCVLERLASHRMDQNEYKKEMNVCLETIKAFTPKENENDLGIVSKACLMEEPAPPAQMLCDSFKRLFGESAETISTLYNFFHLLSAFIPHSQHSYYILLVEGDAILKKEKQTDLSPLEHWKEEKAYELEAYLRERVATELSSPQPSIPFKEEDSALLKDLKLFPETKQKYFSYLVSFFETLNEPFNPLTPYLAHLVNLIDDGASTCAFIDRILSLSPTVHQLETIFTILETARQYPECRRKLKEWILKETSPLMCSSLVSLVKKGCPEDSEEVFYAIDSPYLKRINELLNGSVREMAAFLDSLQADAFPLSTQGKNEYLQMVVGHIENWNPVFWLLLRRCGPVEIAQKWRINWLEQYGMKKPNLATPEEMLNSKGPSEGYFLLVDLFGVEHLPKALKLLKEVCKQSHEHFMPLYHQMRSFLVTDKALPELDSRNSDRARLYADLVGEFNKCIDPLLTKCTSFQKYLEKEDWVQLSQMLTPHHPEDLKVLLGQLENWLSQQFLRHEMQKTMAIYQMALKKVCEKESSTPTGYIEGRKILKAFSHKLEGVFLKLEGLYQFYKVFSSYAYHRVGGDWLNGFEKGMWNDYFPLLNQTIRHTFLKLLNHHLPLHQNAISCLAWGAAYQLLLGNCDKMQTRLYRIESAILHPSAQALSSLSFDQDKRWRTMLGSLLPSTTGGVACISLTLGKCHLDPILSDTLSPTGECLVQQQNDHSHPVKRMQKGEIDVHFKWMPTSFGLQLVSHYLYRCVLGGESPRLDLIKIIGKQGFFQLSETFDGISLEDLLKDRTKIPTFDLLSFSQNFLRILLECERDGTQKNYKAILKGTAYALCNVDTEVVFHPPYKIEKTKSEEKVKIHLKSILLCLDEMNQRIHEAIAKRISEMDLEKTLQIVLILCKQAHCRKINCFEEQEEIKLWEQKGHSRYVGIPFQLRYLKHWYMLLWRLKQMLKDGAMPTHWEILEAIFPIIANAARKAHHLKGHPNDRFDYLHQSEYSIVSLLKGQQSHKTLLTLNSQSILSNCLAEREDQPIQPSSIHIDLDSAFSHLADYHAQSQHIQQVRMEVKGGNLDRFMKQDQIFREQVLWGDHPKERIVSKLDKETQNSLLNAMRTCSFERLYLGDCPALTGEILLNLLESSPTLQVLDLTGCKILTPVLCGEIAKRALFLKELTLSKSQLTGIFSQGFMSPGSLLFPTLVKLEADSCESLNDIRINAPELRYLSLNGCFQLSHVDIVASKLCRIGGEDTWLKFAAELEFMKPSTSSETSRWAAHRDSRGKGGQSLLHGCARYHLIKPAVSLLKKAKPDLRDNHSITPFHIAAQKDDCEMLQLLYEHKASPISEDEKGNTPLLLAAQNGSANAVEWLLKRGVGLDHVNKDCCHAIHLAALHNQAHILSVLCRHPQAKNLINSRYQNLSGQTPLHLAAMAGAVEAAGILLKYNANVALLNSSQRTALHEVILHTNHSLLNKRKILIRLLIRKGIAKNHTDIENQAPLHLAVKKRIPLTLVIELLKAGSDSNVRGTFQRTPLHEAADLGFIEFIEPLCDHRADVNAVDSDGCTPLHYACMKGNVEAVRVLYSKHNANPKIANQEHLTPLELAKRYQQNRVFQEILSIFNGQKQP